jgi:hypothetical protein
MVWIELVNRVLPRGDLVLESDPEARAPAITGYSVFVVYDGCG